MWPRWTELVLIVGITVTAMAGFTGCSSPSVREASGNPPAVANGMSDSEVTTRMEQATAALRGGEPARARAILETVVQEAPATALAWVNLGTAALKLDESEAAIDALERAVTLAPSAPAAHNLLGVAYRRGGQIDEAMAAYRTALRLDPDHALAHYNLAILHDVYLQQPERAIEHYRRFDALTPEPTPEIDQWVAQLEAGHGG